MKRPPMPPEMKADIATWVEALRAQGHDVLAEDVAAKLRNDPEDANRTGRSLASITSAVSARDDHWGRRILAITELVQRIVREYPTDPIAAAIAYGQLKQEPDAFAGRGTRNQRKQESADKLRADSDPDEWAKIDAALAEAGKTMDQFHARKFVRGLFNLKPYRLRKHIERLNAKKKTNTSASVMLRFPTRFDKP
jgi:hypothetical protein